MTTRWLLLSVLWLCGCATLVAPVSMSPSDNAAKVPAASGEPLVVEALEGRPNGLLLRLKVRLPPQPSGTRLSLWRLRSLDDEEGQPLLDQPLHADAARLAALSGEGLGVLDSAPGQDGQVAIYILRISPPSPMPQLASKPLIVRWQAPMPPPRSLAARADLPGVVELTWRPAPGCQHLIFRRALGAQDPRPARLALLDAADGGLYIDRAVEPGQVYAYRVACVRTADALPFYGRATTELYVEAWTRQAPRAPAQADSAAAKDQE
jgi:hypothetical protein